MSRLPGVPLGDAPFTSAQTASLGRALRRTYDISTDALVEAGVVERIYGPSTLPGLLLEWLSEPHDLALCQDPDQIEHIASRLTAQFDPEALVAAVNPSMEQRDRMRRYRPLWAAFWLAMLLPGNRGFRRNPPGTTEEQVRHLVALIS